MISLLRNESTLFWGASRRLFTLSAAPLLLLLLLLPLAGLWTQPPAPAEAFAQCLALTLAGAILLSMNLFPQEMEDGTLEITFTLPSPRGRLVLRQVGAVWAWMLFYFALIAFYYQLVSGASWWAMAGAVLPAALLFSAFTLWLSAHFRNGPLAGLVAGVVAWLHYHYLPRVGFLALFVNPFQAVSDSAGRIVKEAGAAGGVPGSRAAVFWALVLTYVFVELLLRRMQKSELWLK